MRNSLRFCILILLSVVLPRSSQASVSAICRAALARLLVAVEPKFPNRGLRQKLTDGETVTLELGEELGHGADATAYIVRNPKDFGITWPGPIVVRIPHAFRILPDFIREMKTEAAPQGDAYDLLRSQLGNIQGSSYYPSSPAWGAQTLPMIPVLGRFNTAQGQITFKPLVRGMELKEIRAKYPDALPEAMVSGLEELFSLSSAIWDRVTLPENLRTRNLDTDRFALDLIPRNLVWLEIDKNPELAAHLALTRNTFVCFESDFAKGAKYRKQVMSFDEYLGQFIKDTPVDYVPNLRWFLRPGVSPNRLP